MQRLKEAAEKAKIELSGVTTTNINLPVYHRRRHRPEAPGRDPDPRQVQRADRATWWKPLLGPVRQALSAMPASPATTCHKVLMVGGSSLYPRRARKR